MMKCKSYFGWFLITVLLVIGIERTAIRAEAADNQPVLLVYDSKNVAEHGDLSLDRCQRLLTSFGLRARTVQLSQYHQHMLKTGRYQGVITMVNWAQSRSQNQAFEQDRARFNGIKLHIGPNLQADERTGLGGTFKTLTHQQLNLHQGRARQPLSANKTLLVNDRRTDGTQSIGWLTSQTQPATLYSYGVVVGQAGFLPELGKDGLSMTLAGQLLARLFRRPSWVHRPMLTITGITPYTRLDHLQHLIDQLAARGFPFALSIVSVAQNTNLKAFHRYTKVLRSVEKAGGLIFWSPVTEIGTQRLNETELRSVFQIELASLGADRVIPVGVSAAGYWNRSVRRQRAVLNQATHVLMLPDQPQKLEQPSAEPEAAVTTSQQFDTGIVGIPFKAFETATFRGKIKFTQPTALLVNMPAGQREINDLMQQLQTSNFKWFDPVQDQLKTTLKTAATSYGYRAGQYLFNGEPITDLDAGMTEFSDSHQRVVKTSWMNQIIQWQSQALLWLFAGIGLLLAGLLIVGRHIYRGKFIHSHMNKDR